MTNKTQRSATASDTAAPAIESVGITESYLRQLEAENERLTRQNNVAVERMRIAEFRESELQERFDTAASENERLRAALDQVRAVVKTGIPVDRADALAAWRLLEIACRS